MECAGRVAGRLAVLSPFGRDGRANASEGNGVSFGEGEGEAWAWPSASRFEQLCGVASVGSKIPHLHSSPPSARGEATKRTRVGIYGARFHEK